ncbi:SRA stem-loop-interacting RNA-binding protein, mitochondrial [Eupeodes corollae]|uniref:SRA stem-loop-interacting RNA-binding protein, mitochondrial n=1 Tax=Eupeodes corollae TaxID=290404 RepID=UPI002493CF63|nr:SRA stem-loop-interacting RNA-binding protein, mitochondrial [Eupeodes corollae]
MSQASFLRNSYKLFVGNLPWTVGSRELQLYFSKFGNVANASVIFDKNNGFSKSYGFVVFSTRDAFNSASNHTHHLLDGRVLRVQEASN